MAILSDFDIFAQTHPAYFKVNIMPPKGLGSVYIYTRLLGSIQHNVTYIILIILIILSEYESFESDSDSVETNHCFLNRIDFRLFSSDFRLLFSIRIDTSNLNPLQNFLLSFFPSSLRHDQCFT